MTARPLLVLLALLCGCASSPPVHYHALINTAAPQPGGSARARVEILPIAVPERVNRTEMVLTDAHGALDVRDSDHWAAPLPDEIRQWIADALWRRLRAIDSYQAPVVASNSDTLPQYRLALRIDRFDATPGGNASVEASWTLRPLPQGPSASCRASFTVALTDTTPAAAAAALAKGTGQLANAVAESLSKVAEKAGTVCGP